MILFLKAFSIGGTILSVAIAILHFREFGL